MQEHIVVGPPGCGKTTWAARQVERHVERYGPDRCLAISLTRAAARELAGRTELSRQMVGTLHSHCFRALGQPKMVNAAAITAWNDEYPDWALSGTEREEAGDQPPRETLGDRFMALVERARHHMVPVPESAKNFAEAWEDHKSQEGLVDFTDMIEHAYNDVPMPPGNPAALIADEYQDHSKLELTLLRSWAQYVDHFGLIGDPNQSIYHWRHAAEETAHAVPTIVLGQSYRVPRAVQSAAVALGKRSSTYLNAEYKPREEEGSCVAVNIGWSEAERTLNLIDRLEGTVMFLATCAYMLNPFITLLRKRGIPYHNPYRSDSAWSPLQHGTERRRTATDRIEAWCACVSAMTDGVTLPSPEQISLLAKTMLRTGARPVSQDDIDWMSDGATVEQMQKAIRKIFTDMACQAMLNKNIDWFAEHSQAATRRALQYPITVYKRLGLEGLRAKPNIILGTIHSVKGGQADHVILAPDLSMKGMETFRRPGWAHHDGVLRTFYVGMTRARQTLTILRQQGWAVEIPVRG